MSPTVLVTGASGFVAAHVVHEFLSNGYNVVGTVRSDSSAAEVKKSHPDYPDQLSTVIVRDIVAEGGFDEAVKGVDGVIHVASPFQLHFEDNKIDLLDPAVKGTTSILKAIKKNNPNVKRVVITSSFSSVLDLDKGLRPGYVYSEKDWNPVTYETATASRDPAVVYSASKVFAEQAAFDYVKNEKPNFTISTICSPMIYGPNRHFVKNLDRLNTSSGEIWSLINGSSKEIPPNGFYAFADVHDVAKAHRLAYENPDASMQRYLVTTSAYIFQNFVDIIVAKFPELRDSVPVGKPGAPLPDVYRLDTTKAKTELGMEFTSMEKMIVDTVQNLLDIKKALGQ